LQTTYKKVGITWGEQKYYCSAWSEGEKKKNKGHAHVKPNFVCEKKVRLNASYPVNCRAVHMEQKKVM
jgi:hypothetical protein